MTKKTFIKLANQEKCLNSVIELLSYSADDNIKHAEWIEILKELKKPISKKLDNFDYINI